MNRGYHGIAESDCPVKFQCEIPLYFQNNDNPNIYYIVDADGCFLGWDESDPNEAYEARKRSHRDGLLSYQLWKGTKGPYEV